MNINLTLIVQMLVFAIFIWVVMKFIWPIILGAMNEREKKIAAGLAAAEQGQKDLSEAKSRADEVIKEARARAQTIDPGTGASQPDHRRSAQGREPRRRKGPGRWPRRRSTSRAIVRGTAARRW